jgi:hypothetical protein
MLVPTLDGDAVGSDAAAGGADRRSAKNAAAPNDQSRKAHHPAWPLHSPEGHTAPDAPNPRATVHEATGDPLSRP